MSNDVGNMGGGPAAPPPSGTAALPAVPILTWRAPLFVLVPVVALVAALASRSALYLDYVHVMSGALWTGFDVSMGIVIGPILRRLDPPLRAQFVQRLVPTTLFLLPALAAVAVTAGIYLAASEGIFNLGYLTIQVAGILVVLLTVQGFGLFLPNSVRIVLELRRARPDIARVGRIGLLNARLAGVQAVFQVVLIFVMANLASGHVNF